MIPIDDSWDGRLWGFIPGGCGIVAEEEYTEQPQ